jgi:Serpin (serine protease inhibitor)
MVTESARPETDLFSVVDSYARRICPAVLNQHSEDSVSSPLGLWLLLAACATESSGTERTALEEALGCTASKAAGLLAEFLEVPPTALRSAMALWVKSVNRSTPLVEWSASLPASIERGPLPSQVDADAWINRQTEGLIARFPFTLSADFRLVLVSALATKVSWEIPFHVDAALANLRKSSPWRGKVNQVLVDYVPSPVTMLATTEAAGVVAVHFAQAVEDLGVLSVAAAATADRQQVFEAAYELARRCRTDTLSVARQSLFELPEGDGDSWQIAEEEVSTYEEGRRTEGIEYAVLPAWRIESQLDLKASALFGCEPALAALLELIGHSPEGDKTLATQSAIASFTPTGFEAAAASIFGVELGFSGGPPEHRGLQRRARPYFDHSYAAIGLAGTSSDFRRARAGHTDSFCLPFFSTWIETPGEPQPAS